jgi:cytochrome c553
MKNKISRQFLLIIIVLFFLYLMTGCQSKTTIENTINVNKVAETDSLYQVDLWLNYSYSERQGKILYDRYCASCHGNQGSGDGFNAYTLKPQPKNLSISNSTSENSLLEIIKKGGRGVNRSILMPAYGNTLTDEEIATLIDYIKSFSKIETK